MALVARRVVYEGRVQGVGFRRRAEQVAQGRPVAGFVRNLPDGSVELVAEGEAAAVRGFLDGVAQRMAREIAAARESALAPEGYEGFVIRR